MPDNLLVRFDPTDEWIDDRRVDPSATCRSPSGDGDEQIGNTRIEAALTDAP